MIKSQEQVPYVYSFLFQQKLMNKSESSLDKKKDSFSHQSVATPLKFFYHSAEERLNNCIETIQDFMNVLNKKAQIQNQYTYKLSDLTTMRSFVNLTNASQLTEADKIMKIYLQTFKDQYIVKEISLKQIYHNQLADIVKYLQNCFILLKKQKQQLQSSKQKMNRERNKYQRANQEYLGFYRKLKDKQELYLKQYIVNPSHANSNSIMVEINTTLSQQIAEIQQCLWRRKNSLNQAIKQYIGGHNNANQQIDTAQKLVYKLSQKFIIAYSDHHIFHCDKSMKLYSDNASLIKSRWDSLQQARQSQIEKQFHRKSSISLPQNVPLYINSLYKDIISTKFQQLINLNLTKKNTVPTAILDTSMISPQYLPKQQIGYCPKNTVEKIGKLFHKIFMENQKIQEEFQELVTVMKTSVQNRKVLIYTLDIRYKGENFQLPTQNLQSIGKFLYNFLDHCREQNDVFNSKRLMYYSQSFYFLLTKQKVFLYYLIKAHPIFHEVQWWECTIFFSCFQNYTKYLQNKKNNVSQKQHKTSMQMKKIKGSGKVPSSSNKFVPDIINILNTYKRNMEIYGFSDRNRVINKFINMFKIKNHESQLY